MSVPEGTGSGVNPSLFASLRSFWSVLVAILHTRLELATVELEDVAIHGLTLVAVALVSLLALFSAFFWATFFVLALFWDTQYRLWVIGGTFAFYFIAGAVCFVIARNMILSRPRFLGQTLAELRRDVEGLKKSMSPPKEEATKP